MPHSTVPRTPPAIHDTDSAERRQRFRRVMGELAAGVTVLTTTSPSGPVGMTTSAVTSLSLDPLLILACLANRSGTLALIREHGTFAVNILAATMDHTSQVFAEKPLLERFAGIPHHHQDGVPILDDAVAAVTCRVDASHPGGDHTILIGAVISTRTGQGDPLLRHRGAYHRLGRPGAAAEPSRAHQPVERRHGPLRGERNGSG
ncbi:flavin reductase family protein [Streptomyces sp. b94]|uniref:flavin reductase family protein n=1 Tax=Streptomyces sp. b94 TaxID=1827634 RepID=UPI001B358DE9|nr:flavin reductase family protein [Streptomyces sp. b94]MBQ1098273.1 flavin reductase family protein [Streptomyces sp. b94]